jgi:hypothetical protein
MVSLRQKEGMDRTAFLPATEAFGYWFSGLVDGEGCFSIAKTPWGFRCEFIIKLRADDLPMLEEIQTELGIGRINAGEHSTAGINGKGVSTYVARLCYAEGRRKRAGARREPPPA